jgi:hypothetical protein
MSTTPPSTIPDNNNTTTNNISITPTITTTTTTIQSANIQYLPNTTTTTTTIPISGISLNHLLKITDKINSLHEFVEQIVKPKTSTNKETYVEYLAREHPDCVSTTTKAEYFISYLWTMPVKQLLLALQHTLVNNKSEQDVFIWLDICCTTTNNNNNKTSLIQSQQIIGEVIKYIGKFIFVISDWQDPLYAKRSRCVYEIYLAKLHPEVEISLATSQAEEENLIETLKTFDTMNYEFIDNYFSRIDVEKATAKEPDDQQAVLELIRQFGVAEINTVI